MEDLLNKIKDLMVSKNIQTLELPTYEWNPNPDSEADCGNGEYLYQYRENYDQTEYWNTYVRRVKLVDGEVLFDLEEVYEDVKDNYEPLEWYENQRLECTEQAERALKAVLWELTV